MLINLQLKQNVRASVVTSDAKGFYGCTNERTEIMLKAFEMLNAIQFPPASLLSIHCPLAGI